jgi:predicted alpha/beta hydrolase family esterase
MPYDYDAQIRRLTEDPSLIEEEWVDALGLFQFCSPDGQKCNRYLGRDVAHSCGCLTMVHEWDSVYRRRDGAMVPDEALTAAVRNDDRIPTGLDGITIESLPVFKEWQERLDREIRS